jgi:hypothetical protein
VTPLPWPPEWRRPSLGGWLGAVVFGLLAVFLVPAAVLAVRAGQWVGAGVTGGVLLVLAPIALGSRPRRRGDAVDEVPIDVGGVRQAGVRVPVRPTSPLVSLALTVLGLAITGLGVAAFVIAAVRGDWSALAGFVVLLVVGSVLLLGGVAGLVASRKRLGLQLTPSHLVVGLGGEPVVLTWEQLARIGATSVRYGVGVVPRPVQNWLTVVAHEPVDAVARLNGRRSAALGRLAAAAPANVAAAIPAERLGADPALVYHALRYYLEHAGARPELGTGAAGRRLAAGDVMAQRP